MGNYYNLFHIFKNKNSRVPAPLHSSERERERERERETERYIALNAPCAACRQR